MKALQQRKKNMAKRAEETKKKQVLEDVNPKKAIAETQDDNKENQIQIHYPDPEMLQFEREAIQQNKYEMSSEHLPALSEFTPEPVLDFASEDIAEQDNQPIAESAVMPDLKQPLESALEPAREEVVAQATQPIAEPVVTPGLEQPLEPVETQPEHVADATIPNLEDGLCSPTSGSVADNIVSTDCVAAPLENVQKETETSPTPPDDETRLEHEDSAIPSIAPPTFSVDVPLQNESPQHVSENVPETNFEILSVTHVPTEEPSEESILVEVPESVPLPATPSVTPPDRTGTEIPTAPASVSVYPSPVDESTPDHPIADKAEPRSLDQRRRVHLEPIQVLTPDYSDDDNLLSDDSFMEELTSATLQEARPVSVKSPNSGDHSWRNSRVVSTPYSMGSSPAMQGLAAGRSISSSYSDNGPSTPVLMAKKINVSSGISSRIKALEKFSSREGTPMGSSPALNAPSASSSFENLRKRASISLPSGNQDSTPPGTMHSTHAPDSFIRAPSLNRHNRQVSVDATRHANSVSVSARILRDADTSPGSSGVELSESNALNLQPSTLAAEQKTTEESIPQISTTEPASHLQDRSMSMSSTGSSRPATSRPGSRPSPPSRTITDETIQSTSSTSEEKKASRTSRLMRRMSSITSTSRRSIIGALSSPVKEEQRAPTFKTGSSKAPGSSSSRTSEPIDIGEVNVQFPETLLWKRRVMRIDEQGYVVLTPGTNDATARNMTKRYHLTEFRTPCLPDEDMQELPNSILLDFLNGSTLQCACESRQGQSSALQSMYSSHHIFWIEKSIS